MFYKYVIGWSTKDLWYYGARYAAKADPSDLWVKYFTSSKYVKAMREQYGEPDIREIRRTFTDKKKCQLWEHNVLRRLKAASSDRWLNKTDNISIHYYSMKKNSAPGRAAMLAKIRGKKYRDVYGEEKGDVLSAKRIADNLRTWKDPIIRQKRCVRKNPALMKQRCSESAKKMWERRRNQVGG
jgi:hypothetical protein